LGISASLARFPNMSLVSSSSATLSHAIAKFNSVDSACSFDVVPVV
jgi:hypothetical protein